MFSSKANYLKLRTNLRLCINRLKLLEKKKTELALKARREISEYIAAGKEDRARIRVEHIIREDYLVEALEIIEMLCDLLLARFGLIEKMSEIDPGLEEAINTILWAAPRLCTDVPELREVAHQLTIKYGKEYADMCRRNGFDAVNEKVLHKMSLAAPPKVLVENYMIEIARTYKVPFEPDVLVMMGQPPETDDLIELGTDTLQDAGKSNGRRGGGFRRGGEGGGGQCVTSVTGYSKHQEAGFPPGGSGMPYGSVGGFPVPSTWNGMPDCAVNSASGPGIDQPGGPVFGTGLPFGACGPDMGGNVSYLSTPGGGGGGLPNMEMPPPYADDVNKGGNLAVDNSLAANVSIAGSNALPDDHHPVAGGVPVLPDEDGNFPQSFQSSSSIIVTPSPGSCPDSSPSRVPPPLPTHPPNPTSPRQSLTMNQPDVSAGSGPFLPPYDDVIHLPDRPIPHSRSPVPGSSATPNHTMPDFPVLPDVPGLPSVPTNSIGRNSLTSDDVDFDDLTRRFEELKKRK